MSRIIENLKHWITAQTALPPAPDALEGLSAAELADLPPMHPHTR